MKKKIIFVILILVLVFIYKYKQRTFMGLSKPKIETEKSIVKYARDNNLNGEILVAKDKKSYDILKKYFDYGFLYVLNKDLELLDCNIEKLGGRCFQDIQDDICKGKEIKKRVFTNLTGKKIIKKLFLNSKSITNNDSIVLKKYDNIYIYTWVKYAKASVNKSSIQFINCLNKNKLKNKYLILTVNTDSLRSIHKK